MEKLDKLFISFNERANRISKMKTILPDKLLKFNEWAEYIRKENNKNKY